MILSRRAFQWLLPAVFLVVAAACVPASKGDLEQTQTQLAALQQRVDGMNTSLEAARAGLTTTQGDVAGLKQGLTTAQGDVTTLKGNLAATQGDVGALKGGLATTQGDVARVKDGLTTTQSDVSTLKGSLATAAADLAKARTDLTSATNSLNDLKNSFLLSRQDLDKLQTAQAKNEKLAKLELVAHLYEFVAAATNRSEFDIAMAAVGDATKAIGDGELSSSWTNVDNAIKAYLATPQGSPQSEEAQKLANNAESAFVTLLRQRLVDASK